MNAISDLEFEVVFVLDGVEDSFYGTALEVAIEIQLRQVLTGTCIYYIPLKVGFLTGVD